MTVQGNKRFEFIAYLIIYFAPPTQIFLQLVWDWSVAKQHMSILLHTSLIGCYVLTQYSNFVSCICMFPFVVQLWHNSVLTVALVTYMINELTASSDNTLFDNFLLYLNLWTTYLIAVKPPKIKVVKNEKINTGKQEIGGMSTWLLVVGVTTWFESRDKIQGRRRLKANNKLFI